MIRDTWHRLRAIFRRDVVEREVDDELRHHFDLQVSRYVAGGCTHEAAMRQARLDIGGMDQIKEEHRDARGTRGLEDFWRDTRLALRMLRRAPVFAATAILIVGLGVGVNTLVFSVVEGLVLRPLPIEEPDRVWFVQRAGSFVSHSFPLYRELRDRNRTFAQLAGYRITMMHVETPQGPLHTWGYLATGSYFDLLSLTPFLGRFFHPADDVAPGASPYAVLSYDYWRTTFGAQDSIVGTTIRINRQPYTVLGVAPPAFRGTEVFYRPAIWVPMTMQAQIEVGNPWLDNPRTANTWIIGRLADDVTPAQARDDLSGIVRQVAIESGTSAPDPDVIRLTSPGLVGDAIGGPARAFGFGLLALAGLVLLAACANLAGGLAARGADRKREFAIRVAIGAGRNRLIRQLLTETMVLVAIGGAVGAASAALVGAAFSRWQLRDIVERLRAHPGVRDVAYGNSFPLNIDQSSTTIYSDELRALSPADAVRAAKYQISPDYFRTLGIRILQGRDFTWQDSDNAERVAIVNEALARRALGDSNPVGRQVRFGPAGPAVTAVGVVETGKYQTLTEAETAAVFEPMLQVPNTTTVILARSTGVGTGLASAMRQVVREVDPALPLIGVRSVGDAIGYVRLPMQAAAIALGAFGILAAALAATGIHGVVAYAVSRRRRELAIRVALGAPRSDLVRLVVRRTFVLVFMGTITGMAVTFGVRSVLTNVLYMPATESFWPWAAVVVLVTSTSLAACAWPVWRALTVDPVAALAAE